MSDTIHTDELICIKAGADIIAEIPISDKDKLAALRAAARVKRYPRGTFSGMMAQKCLVEIEQWWGSIDDEL
jgi:hypothetical protein